jgi:hypothetical protein
MVNHYINNGSLVAVKDCLDKQSYSLEYPGDENAKREIDKRIFNVST